MASRTFSLEEVLTFLDCREGTDGEQSQVMVNNLEDVLMSGSDEKLDTEEVDSVDLDNDNDGTGLLTVFYDHCIHAVGLWIETKKSLPPPPPHHLYHC